MLKTMREGGAYFIKGVMLFVVVTFLGTIFVVWGVKSTPGDLAGRGVIATVGGVEISQETYQQALRRQVEMYRQLFGDRWDEKLLEGLNVKRRVAEQLVRRQLILHYAAGHGLTVSDEEVAEAVRQYPAFGGKEGFNRQRYVEVLKANRMTPEWFETQVRKDLTERKVEELVREAARVSEAEAWQAFQRARRKLTVEVAQLPAGEAGKKAADTITVAMGKGASLKEAAREAGVTTKSLGPFAATAPPREIPDPQAFRQAAGTLAVGETSPLVAAEKASYLIRLAGQEPPARTEFEKERKEFQAQLLAYKQEMVLADWLNQVRQATEVVVDAERL